MRIERCRIPNALTLEKLHKKIHNCALLQDVLALSWLYQNKIQIPFFSQVLVIIFSYNNQQLEPITAIAVICFSH